MITWLVEPLVEPAKARTARCLQVTFEYLRRWFGTPLLRESIQGDVSPFSLLPFYLLGKKWQAQVSDHMFGI